MTESTILFDLDGTLADSAVGIERSFAHAMSACGLEPLPERRLRALVGPPLHDSFNALGLSPADVGRAVVHYREYFGDHGMFESRLYDGIEELLRALRGRGFRLAVATSKPTVFAERIVDHFRLTEHFAQVVGANLDGTRSQKHEVLAEALARLRVSESSAATMVGDRAQDVHGATSVGISCVGAGWGYGEDGELEAAGAACVLAAPVDLLSCDELRPTPLGDVLEGEPRA